MRKVSWLSLFVVIGSMTSAIATVGTGFSLFGQASFVSPGHNSNRAVKLISDATAGTFSGIDFSVPATLTIDNLNMLSTDNEFTAGSCGLGSPRFGIKLAGVTGTIFVYIGPPPSYTGCPPNAWTNTGNLLTPASLVDTSQLPGGTFYDPWASAQARYTGKAVTDIFLVSDSGPGPSFSQTVLIDNTNVNGTVYDYEPTSKDDCKDNGWQSFTLPPGPFKNQGQCVSHFATQK